MPPPLRFLSPSANRLHPAIIARSPAGARTRARAAGDRQQERRNTTLEKERRNTTASSNKKNNVFLPAYLVTSTSRLLRGRVGSICNGHCPTAPTVCSHSHTPEAQISETENGHVPVVTADTCTDPQQRRDHCTGKKKSPLFRSLTNCHRLLRATQGRVLILHHVVLIGTLWAITDHSSRHMV